MPSRARPIRSQATRLVGGRRGGVSPQPSCGHNLSVAHVESCRPAVLARVCAAGREHRADRRVGRRVPRQPRAATTRCSPLALARAPSPLVRARARAGRRPRAPCRTGARRAGDGQRGRVGGRRRGDGRQPRRRLGAAAAPRRVAPRRAAPPGRQPPVRSDRARRRRAGVGARLLRRSRSPRSTTVCAPADASRLVASSGCRVVRLSRRQVVGRPGEAGGSVVSVPSVSDGSSTIGPYRASSP